MHDLYTSAKNVIVFEKLNSILLIIEKIISHKSTVKKLLQHPINQWHESLLSEYESGMLSQGHILINEKESNELFLDFKKSNNRKLYSLVEQYYVESQLLAQELIDPHVRKKFIEFHTLSTSKLASEEIKIVKFLRSL